MQFGDNQKIVSEHVGLFTIPLDSYIQTSHIRSFVKCSFQEHTSRQPSTLGKN